MSYAPYKIRIYAFLIDYLVIIVYGVFVVGTISIIFRSHVSPLFLNSPVTAELTGFIMITLPVSLYFALSESSKWQGTFGKRKMGVRVANDVGDRIGISRSIFRTTIKFLPWEIAHFGIWRLILTTHYSEMTILIILSIVNIAILIYLITPLTNKSRKNVYDWIAGTKVVQS